MFFNQDFLENFKEVDLDEVFKLTVKPFLKFGECNVL